MFGNKKNNKMGNSSKNDLTGSNHLQANTTVKGTIESKGNVRIDGHVIGDITSSNKVVLGTSSKVEGDIKAKNLDVAGHVTGKIIIQESLILKSSAVINGEIITKDFSSESGCVFNGTCKMTTDRIDNNNKN